MSEKQNPQPQQPIKNDYEAELEKKRSRYQQLAVKAQSQSSQYYQQSKRITECIPFGQPILVGHHSERRHRRDLAKSDRAMRQSIEAEKKAEYYRQKAESVGKGGISSDDPEAIAKLKMELEKRIARQQKMKAANKALRKGNLTTLQEMGYTEKQIAQLQTPDFVGRIGYPDYELSNNNAQIRRIKKRIAELEEFDQLETTSSEPLPGIKVVENVEENRIQIFFEEKPAAQVRQILKCQGFRWSRSNVAWQRQLNNAGRTASTFALQQSKNLSSR